MSATVPVCQKRTIKLAYLIQDALATKLDPPAQRRRKASLFEREVPLNERILYARGLLLFTIAGRDWLLPKPQTIEFVTNEAD